MILPFLLLPLHLLPLLLFPLDVRQKIPRQKILNNAPFSLHPDIIVATHVDRLPLVSSAIIQVAQDLDEPWPVEVYDHNGKAHNVTMLPGDMVLYESHSVLHGRFYANIFVHFKPIDHDAINEVELAERSKAGSSNMAQGIKKFFSRPKKPDVISGHEQSNHDPVEIRRHKDAIAAEAAVEADAFLLPSEETERSEEEVEQAETEAAEEAAEEASEEAAEDDIRLEENDIKDGRTALHVAAGRGDLTAVQRLLKVVVEGAGSESDLMHARDANDWQAIHECARAGHLDVLEYLVAQGADLTAQTKGGGSVLYWARRNLDEHHPVIEYLEELGAPDTEEIEEPQEEPEHEGFLW